MCDPPCPGLAGTAPLCFSESFTADHKPLMGEAPEVRGFFLGCGFNSAGKRDLRGSSPAGIGSQADPGIPQPCLASWPRLHPPLSPRDDAGRRLRQGTGSLDHPRPAGEGHVRLRHQASHPHCPSSLLIPGGPWGCFPGRAGCWIGNGCPGSVCVPPRSWNQLHAAALMSVRVGFISCASLRSHTNSFQQARGDGGGGEGRGN